MRLGLCPKAATTTECLPSLCECAQPSFYQVEAAIITNCLSSVKRLYQPFFQRVEGCECNGLSIEFV